MLILCYRDFCHKCATEKFFIIQHFVMSSVYLWQRQKILNIVTADVNPIQIMFSKAHFVGPNFACIAITKQPGLPCNGQLQFIGCH